MAQLYRDQTGRPPRPESVVIPGPAGPLEAIVEDPGAEDGDEAGAFAVVCHPHPLYQGTMRNKVVHTLARAAIRLGTPAVRFNFRGVGASSGTWDEGDGETADALSVIEWGRRRWPERALWLAGFSFGAFVALQAAASTAPGALVVVAPPVQRFPPDGSRMPAGPWLLVQGEEDELVDFREVLRWAKTCPVPPRLALLPETSHFFHGRLGELQARVQDFLGRVMEQEEE